MGLQLILVNIWYTVALGTGGQKSAKHILIPLQLQIQSFNLQD